MTLLTPGARFDIGLEINHGDLEFDSNRVSFERGNDDAHGTETPTNTDSQSIEATTLASDTDIGPSTSLLRTDLITVSPLESGRWAPTTALFLARPPQPPTPAPRCAPPAPLVLAHVLRLNPWTPHIPTVIQYWDYNYHALTQTQTQAKTAP